MTSPRIKPVWLVIGMLVTIVPSPAQDTATVGDFTKCPTEHIINWLEQPFVVRSVKGILLGEGDQRPFPGVLIAKSKGRAPTERSGEQKAMKMADSR
jgi:hypothetical protein